MAQIRLFMKRREFKGLRETQRIQRWRRGPAVRQLRERLTPPCFNINKRGWPYKDEPYRAQRLREVLHGAPGEVTSWGELGPQELFSEILVRARCNVPGILQFYW